MKKAPAMRFAVDTALTSAKVAPEDKGAVALARLYATRLDEAEALAEEAARQIEHLDAADEWGRQRLSALSRRVSAQQAAVDLGPRLEAVLTALGMTLRGRVARTTGRGGETDVKPASAFDELKARRAARQSGAATLDA